MENIRPTRVDQLDPPYARGWSEQGVRWRHRRRADSFSPILGGGAGAIELTIEVDRPLPSLGVGSTTPYSPQHSDYSASTHFIGLTRARTAARRAWRWTHRRRAGFFFSFPAA